MSEESDWCKLDKTEKWMVQSYQDFFTIKIHRIPCKVVYTRYWPVWHIQPELVLLWFSLRWVGKWLNRSKFEKTEERTAAFSRSRHFPQVLPRAQHQLPDSPTYPSLYKACWKKSRLTVHSFLPHDVAEHACFLVTLEGMGFELTRGKDLNTAARCHNPWLEAGSLHLGHPPRCTHPTIIPLHNIVHPPQSLTLFCFYVAGYGCGFPVCVADSKPGPLLLPSWSFIEENQGMPHVWDLISSNLIDQICGPFSH